MLTIDDSPPTVREVHRLARVLLALIPVALVGGLVGGYLWGRSVDRSRSAVTTVAAVASHPGTNEMPVVCVEEATFGAEYDQKCGAGYSRNGLRVDDSLVGTKVRVVRLDRQDDGLNVMLLSRP